MKTINSKDLIINTVDEIQNDLDSFCRLIKRCEKNNYLSDKQIAKVLCLAKFPYDMNDIKVALLKAKMINLISDSYIKSNVLLNHNFCKQFIDHSNFFKTILINVDFDYLIDNVSRVNKYFQNELFDVILEKGSKENLIKYLNNAFVLENVGNNNVSFNRKQLQSDKMLILLNTKFFNKAYTSKKYANIYSKIFKLNKNFESIPDEFIKYLKDLNLSDNKKILIIKNLDLNSNLKNKLAKAIFNRDIDISKETRKIIKKVKEMLNCLNDDGLITDLCADIKYNYWGIKSIENILIKLCDNPHKKISKSYFEVFAVLLGKDISKKEFGFNAKIISNNFPYKEEFAMAASYTNVVEFNAYNIKDNFYDNMYKYYNANMLTSIFHELTHIKQYRTLFSNEYNYIDLKNTIEHIFFNNINYYLPINEYYSLSYEADAYINAPVLLYNYLKRKGIYEYFEKGFSENNISFDKNYLKILNEVLELRDNYERFMTYKNRKYIAIDEDMTVKLNKINTRKFIDKNDLYPKSKKYYKNELFNERFSPNKIIKLLKKYPVLKCIFNDDGKAKSFEELLEKYNYYSNKIKSGAYNSNDLNYYGLYSYLVKDKLNEYDYVHKRKMHKIKSTYVGN